MTDKNKLPFLLNLIDDNTDEVRLNVLAELSNYGLSLERDILEFNSLLTSDSLYLLNPILESNRRKWFGENWNKLIISINSNKTLEEAMNLISVYQLGFNHGSSLTEELNKLAEEFSSFKFLNDECDLSYFLFEEKGLKGDKKNYYNPLNCNPLYCIMNKKGLPITLCIIYMLVGDRLNFKIEGCNFPGHFMAKIWIGNEVVLVDCFNEGRLLFENTVRNISKESAEAIMELTKMTTTAEMIIKRVINNLINSYENQNDNINADFFRNLTYPK